MTRIHTKQPLLVIWGEYPSLQDSTWGCRHMLEQMSAAPARIVAAGLDAFRFYMAKRARGPARVTLITLDLTHFPRLGLALQKPEKPLYLCPMCRDLVLRRLPRYQVSDIPAYPLLSRKHLTRL